jgi:hypothetical protein
MKRTICLLLALLVLGCVQNGWKEKQFKIDISSLSQKNEIKGDFIIGCGNIGQTTYYYVYKNISANKYKLVKLDADETIIVEDSNSPYMLYSAMYDEQDGSVYRNSEGKFELHVPVGTLIKKFKIGE